eukprot:SAG22_NODE_328_length_12271_cov_9.681811_1_plen_51_part_10
MGGSKPEDCSAWRISLAYSGATEVVSWTAIAGSYAKHDRHGQQPENCTWAA